MTIDGLLSEFDVSAAYEVAIQAPRQRVWEELLRADFLALPLVRRLLMLRSLGRRRAPAGTLTLATLSGGFRELARVPEREIIFGIIGRFWRPRALIMSDWRPDQFSAIRPSGWAKAAWDFTLEECGATTVLRTETRVFCLGRSARIKFRLYWFLIGGFSGRIRKEILNLVKVNSEATPAGQE